MSEDTTPSAGWRAVYASLGVSTSADDGPPRACPACGSASRHLRARTYRCPTHGAWATS